MENINAMTLIELKKLAKEKGIEFAPNIKKEELKDLIIGEQKEYSIYEYSDKIKLLECEIKEKTERNEVLNKNNTYLDSRIEESQNDTTISDEEREKQIAHFNKIKQENDRQISNNSDKISNNTNEIENIKAKINEIKIIEADNLNKQYKDVMDQLCKYPTEILNVIHEMVEKYKQSEDIMNKLKVQIINFENDYNVRVNTDYQDNTKLLANEKYQIIQRTKDLSKIFDRMSLR